MRGLRWMGIAVMALLLSACGPQAKPVSASAEADGAGAKETDAVQASASWNPSVAMDRSEQVTEWYRTKQWNRIREVAAPTLREALTDDALEKVWGMAYAEAGDFARIVPHLPFGALSLDALEKGWGDLYAKAASSPEDDQVFPGLVLAEHTNTTVGYRYLWDASGHLVNFDLTNLGPSTCPEDCSVEILYAIAGVENGDYDLFKKYASDDMRQRLTREAFDKIRGELIMRGLSSISWRGNQTARTIRRKKRREMIPAKTRTG